MKLKLAVSYNTRLLLDIHAYLLKNYVIAQFVEAYTQHCLQHMQLGVNCVYSLEKQYQLIYTEEV